MIGRLLVVLLAVVVSSQAAWPERCPAGSPPLYPHPTKCSSYYVCIAGIQQEIQCNKGNWYNKDLMVCVKPWLSGCVTKCSNSEVAEIKPVEGECSKFSVCLLGEEKVLSCPNNWDFRADWKTCVPRILSRCGPSSERCTGSILEPQADPDSCQNFKICVMGRPITKTCANGWYFRDDWKVCVPPMLSPCATAVPNKCKTQSVYPDEKDCSKFYVCVLGVPKEVTCPKNWHYDAKKICVPSLLSKCGGGISIPTTPFPITTPTLPDRCSLMCVSQHWRDRKDCSAYWMCKGKKSVKAQCPSGLAFNDKLNTCDLASEVGCDV